MALDIPLMPFENPHKAGYRNSLMPFPVPHKTAQQRRMANRPLDKFLGYNPDPMLMAPINAQRQQFQAWAPVLMQLYTVRKQRERDWALFQMSHDYLSKLAQDQMRHQQRLAEIEAVGERQTALEEAKGAAEQRERETFAERYRGEFEAAGLPTPETPQELTALRGWAKYVSEEHEAAEEAEAEKAVRLELQKALPQHSGLIGAAPLDELPGMLTQLRLAEKQAAAAEKDPAERFNKDWEMATRLARNEALGGMYTLTQVRQKYNELVAERDRILSTGGGEGPEPESELTESERELKALADSGDREAQKLWAKIKKKKSAQ